MAETQREMLGSRLGFLLVTAGCAIGLGNVWRFPFITGAYGGAWFLLIFIVCQVAVMPVMMLEFAMGRASRRNMGLAFGILEPRGTTWHRAAWLPLVGSYTLLMFYTTIAGWMLVYFCRMGAGVFTGMDTAAVAASFGGMVSDTWLQVGCMSAVVLIATLVCSCGLQHGVERVVKVLMAGLFLVLIVLVCNSLTLDGAAEGLRFYLMPDAEKLSRTGFLSVCSAALNQAFFTLSIGIGAMCIFGSYLDRQRTLGGEVILVTALDFVIALMSGFIIFPACFTYGVEPTAGPGLIFVTLPNIFANMPGGRFWGTLFFVFMSCAALTTVIAVFENMTSYCMDVFGWRRRTATIVNCVALWLTSLPCALSFGVLSFIQPFGEGSGILDLEDFIVSNHMLPLGSLFIILFCTLRQGWGWDGMSAEANMGTGPKVGKAMRFYLRWILPPIILILFVMGYVDKFCH